jgi:U3 small nucleolar RNA-associated protein 10
MLLHHVLDCMFKIFMYDTHHFLSKDRAEALMGPLVDQVGPSITAGRRTLKVKREFSQTWRGSR